MTKPLPKRPAGKSSSQPKKLSSIALPSVIALALVAVAVYAAISFQTPAPADTASTPTPTNTVTAPGEQTVLTGSVVCLPHKASGEVNTQDCAYGIKTVAGEYYALRPAPANINDFSFDMNVTVRGQLESSASTEMYDIKGVITGASIIKS